MQLDKEAITLISQFTLLFVLAWIVSTAMGKPVFRNTGVNQMTNGDGSAPLMYGQVRI